MRLQLLAVCAMAAVLTSCGYHVGGKADLVPKSIQTVAIPPFKTLTTRYKMIDALPQAIGTEFISRTRFRIVNDPSEADAVLNGSILSVSVTPNVSDPTSGRTTSLRIFVRLSLYFTERTTGKVLYSRPDFFVHQDYAIAVDPHQVFDESGPAFERLNRDVARDVVSAIVENF